MLERFGRLMSRWRRLWVIVGVGLLLVLAALGAAFLDGALGDFFNQSYWRILQSPALVIYTLIVYPFLGRTEKSVLEALRPLVPLDDDGFDRLVAKASHISPTSQLLAFGIGSVIALLLSIVGIGSAGFWVKLYLFLFNILAFGLLSWAIYRTLVSTRLVSELHRQPLEVDIFDLEPFEPIGRQSLFFVLAFIGGTTLSIFFALPSESILAPINLFLYIFFALMAVSFFFLNMRHTHRVLADTKRHELETIKRNIALAYRTLKDPEAENKDAGAIAAELDAWTTFEQRLDQTRTWPYDTRMLRTLFFSVLVPGGMALARAVAKSVFGVSV